MSPARAPGGGRAPSPARIWQGILAFAARGAVAAGLLAASASPLVGQEGSFSVEAGASHALPPAGSSAPSASYANLGARLEAEFGGGRTFTFGAAYGGLALDEGGASWVAGLAGAGFLLPLGRAVSIGLRATGEAFTVSDPFPYRAATAQAEPELRIGDGTTSFRLRGYGGIGASDVAVVDSFFRLTRIGPVLFEAGRRVRTDLWAWGGSAELSRWLGPVQPRVAAEAYDSPQGSYVAGRVGMYLLLGAAAANLEVARWDTPTGPETVATAALEVPLGSVVRTIFGGGRYGPDPLLDAPAAGGATASASWQVARFGARTRVVYRIRYADRPYVRFDLERPGARSVAVVGEFTQWKDVPMLEQESGHWTVELPVEPGTYRFGFRVDGEWYVPNDAEGGGEDEWGLQQVTLIVPER